MMRFKNFLGVSDGLVGMWGAVESSKFYQAAQEVTAPPINLEELNIDTFIGCSVKEGRDYSSHGFLISEGFLFTQGNGKGAQENNHIVCNFESGGRLYAISGQVIPVNSDDGANKADLDSQIIIADVTDQRMVTHDPKYNLVTASKSVEVLSRSKILQAKTFSSPYSDVLDSLTTYPNGHDWSALMGTVFPAFQGKLPEYEDALIKLTELFSDIVIMDSTQRRELYVGRAMLDLPTGKRFLNDYAKPYLAKVNPFSMQSVKGCESYASNIECNDFWFNYVPAENGKHASQYVQRAAEWNGQSMSFTYKSDETVGSSVIGMSFKDSGGNQREFFVACDKFGKNCMLPTYRVSKWDGQSAFTHIATIPFNQEALHRMAKAARSSLAMTGLHEQKQKLGSGHSAAIR